MTRDEWLRREPFTLLLSAGFFGFFAHAGLLAALEERELRPRRVGGASAGALAGGLWAAGSSAERLATLFRGLERQDFWDPGLPIGGLLRGRKFGALLREHLDEHGVTHIEDCALEFRAVVHDLFRRQTVVLDEGALEPAIRASCALPLMFRPVRVAGRVYIDGGYSDRGGFAAVEEGERTLYHHLPHRSPWSGIAGPESAELAPAPGRLTLSIDALPRVTPFRLERGEEAIRTARDAALRWLEAPLEHGEG
jgi:NTE family protein